MRMLRNSDGMALVLTLAVLAIITAMVVEFAYGVYVNTNALYNWQTLQRLALVSRSAVKLASQAIVENDTKYSYTYPGLVDIPDQNPVQDSDSNVSIRIENENAKFNINTMVFPNGTLNEKAYNSFLRLLKELKLDPAVADRIVDWIDPDSEPRLSDSEKGSKNAYLDSVDELSAIPGIDRESYDRLSPYVTIYGNGLININGAEIPVLISLSDSIDKEMAERIARYRENAPFEKTADILKVVGFETIGTSLMGSISVKGTVFRVLSTATSGGIKKVVESVLEMSGSATVVRYWKEL